MPSTKVKARSKRFNATYWRSKNKWLQWELVGMRPSMDLSDLNLVWQGGGRPLEVSGAVTSLRITRTIEGASEITLIIRDPKGHLFSEKAGRSTNKRSTVGKKTVALTDEEGRPLDAPTLVGRAVEIILDDVPFRLSKVEGDPDVSDEYTLTFEDRIVYWLRKKHGALSVSRAGSTRAEFILKMLREIKVEQIPFICPELSRKQPQAKPAEDGPSLARMMMAEIAVMVDPPSPDVFHRGKPKYTDDDAPTKKKSLTTAEGLTVKGAKATAEQKRNMNEVLDQAWSEDGATTRSVKSSVLAVIAETACMNLEGGDSTSSGILQLLASTAASYNVDPQDIGSVIHLFMTKGFWGKGGAIALAKAHPDWPAYRIAQNVQGSGTGQASEGRVNYGPWMEEADRWLDAYKGKDTSLGGDAGGVYRKSYRYMRDKDEDSWTCGLRLADEVRWRLFPVGRALFYIDEIDLFRREVSENVKRGDPRVISAPWSMDWNKPINEATITVVLDSWSAYPGAVLKLDGYGVPDGRWLVTEMERDWFDNIATFTIKQPLSPLKEPAAETGELEQGVSGEGAKGEIGTLYKVCKNLSDKTPGYVWGGQHGIPFSQMDGNKGLDCSSSTSLALYRADMWDSDLPDMALVSGDFDKWGAPGSGHLFTVMYNNSHVWIQFEEAAGMMYKRFDTGGPGGGSGPKMRTEARSDQGNFGKRHWPGM
jgi:hypothetical protein